MEGLRSQPSHKPPPHPACRKIRTLPTAGREVLSPRIISWLAPMWKKKKKKAMEKTCTRVHCLSCSTRAVSGKELFNHFVRSFAWQIRLRLFPLPLPSLTYICTHVCVCACVCAARESVVGDDGEQGADRPSVHGRPTGCADETTHADAVVSLQPLPSSSSSVIYVVDAGWLRRSC